MTSQNLRVRSRPQAVGLEAVLRRGLEGSPLFAVPFVLGVLVFTLALALTWPLTLPTRDFSLSLSPLALPNDGQLDAFLFESPNLHVTLTAPPKTVTIQEALVTEKTPVLETKTYTLKAGDALSALATKNGLTLGTLISFNNIKNVRKVPVGTTLVLPNADGVLYTVVKGDSLSGIARTHKIGYEQILEANALRSPVLTPGQKLFLPGATISTWELKQASGELFLYPTRGSLTSRFGTRRDPFTGVRTFHNGIDLANRVGTPVRASMAGAVHDVGYNSAYGNYVILKHEGGFKTLYGHLKSFGVRTGQAVAQGQQIGLMGNTGYSTGSHLHFSIFKWNTAVNPLNYLF